MIKEDIVSTFDDRGFKKAESSLTKLGATGKTIGTQLGAVLSVGALVAYGKSAVQAFSDEDRAIKVLGQTLKNLGLGFRAGEVSNYIDRLAKMSGVADDQLRPAFDTLARSFGSVSDAEKMLNLGMDISAGTGNDLEVVVKALAKAYQGNTTSLSKLATGLSKSELASNDFGAITQRLTQIFQGQAGIAADSYAGKIARIGQTMKDAKETIGQGIVTAFSEMTGSNGSVDKFQSAIQNVADNISNIVAGMGVIVGKAGEMAAALAGGNKDNFWTNLLKFTQPVAVGLGSLGKKAKAQQFAPDHLLGTENPHDIASSYVANRNAEIQAKANAEKYRKEQARIAKESLAAKQAELRLAKDAAMLQRSTANQNIQKMEIAAALKGKISDLDKATLQIQLTQLDLQQALQDQNADKADKLAAKLDSLNSKQAQLAKAFSTMPEASDPLKGLKESMENTLKDLEGVHAKLLAIADKDYLIKLKLDTTGLGDLGDPNKTGSTFDYFKQYGGGINVAPMPQGGSTFDYFKYYHNADMAFSSPTVGAAGGGDTYVSVNVQVDGNVTAQDDLVSAVRDSLVNMSASGIGTVTTRQSNIVAIA